MKHIYQITSIAAIALALAYGCKDEVEEKSLPADAGAISGAAANTCPDTAVALSVETLSGAAAYVWYKDGAVIPDASSASYTAVASGSYQVAGKNDDGEGKKSAAHAVAISACPDVPVDTLPTVVDTLPAAAGSIIGSTVNSCPAQTVTLSVDTIEGATSYLWIATYAEDDVDSIRDQGLSYTIDVSSFTEGQQVSVTVSGVNALGAGAASQPHVVAKRLCLAGKPVINGNAEWITETRGDTVVYTTVCPATTMPSLAVASGDEDIIRYDWYRQLVGTDPELTAWTTDGAADRNLGVKDYTYNYAVVAVTADGESERSDIVQVIGTACPVPSKPGGASPLALYPTEAYPQSTPYDFSISNCDVQNITFKAETSVELASNAVSGGNTPTGYAFWVKTPDVDTFRLVKETGTKTSERKIVVDGTTYPAGTYRVTAFNDNGHSEFGSNEVTVVISTDCPAPPVPQLGAPTVITSLTGGVLTNVCPSTHASANLSLNFPSTPPGDVEYITWSRIDPNGGDPEVVWEGEWESKRTIYDDEISVANNGTYRVTYRKTIGGTSYESDPAEVTIALTECSTSGYTRANLIGDYTVTDYRSGRVGFSFFFHELAVAAGASENEIVITNLGNISTSVTATVTFTTDGEQTGIYGVISIPKQQNSDEYKFSTLTVAGTTSTCQDDPLELDLVLVNGQLGVSKTGVFYGIWNTDAACAPIANVRGGGGTNTITWERLPDL
ncbi:MAG: hypothetical protein LBG47_00395 [Prevotellaceae bacterium]|jgi:hypothetical protein|nr:hypothetical protein [Prevotellaceae bacterium]